MTDAKHRATFLATDGLETLWMISGTVFSAFGGSSLRADLRFGPGWDA
ncbi:MAG: hypothetical protein MK160_04040 [Rhodobacteraceae bacterium]|nr:hypothetical protein [Paracoccaceae bacterium]